jgi:hypothetical protein
MYPLEVLAFAPRVDRLVAALDGAAFATVHDLLAVLCGGRRSHSPVPPWCRAPRPSLVLRTLRRAAHLINQKHVNRDV